MELPLYQVDAFASSVFTGNPAAVCPLAEWLPDAVLLNIAKENNLSETAFFVREDTGRLRLRWFTPAWEVDLCGHATMAAAFVIMTELEPGLSRVEFDTRSGAVSVDRDGDLFVLDFPARPPGPVDAPAALVEALGAQPAEILAARDFVCVFDTEAEVRGLAPDFGRLARDVNRTVVATAPGAADDVDFVSRFFAPHAGIDEDPVTGSAHCTLTPYWAERLNSQRLHAHQVSARGGELWVELRGDRVRIAGHAVLYLRGTALV